MATAAMPSPKVRRVSIDEARELSATEIVHWRPHGNNYEVGHQLAGHFVKYEDIPAEEHYANIIDVGEENA